MKTPSYLRDTTDFLHKLTGLGPLPQDCIVVTLDVSSLYTNIPHAEGIEACRKFLETREHEATPSTSYLTKLMEQILTFNNFSFNGEQYLQLQGTAMGTRMAPSYANLFMADLEQELLTGTRRRPYVWWRFIDDIFAIWQHGEESLKIFLLQINSFHSTIRFTSETSREHLSFLDTTVILDGRTIHTDLYTKPTDTHQYLSPESCHPKHCTMSIPYSQGLRIRRICSKRQDFLRRTADLKTYLLARGYQETAVNLQIQRAANIPRHKTLQPRPPRPPHNRTPLVVTYHPSLSSLARITKKHLPVLHTSARLKQAIPNPPLVAFRRPKNLRDLLVRAKLETSVLPTNTGNIPCGRRRCKCCYEIMTTSSFRSHNTGRRYNIRSNITCKSRNLVYLISCKRCGLQYVGETENPLHIRMNGHRSDIRTKRLEKPVAAHFSQPDHSAVDLEVRGIEKIHRDNMQWRKQRESYWIFELKTLIPCGLNLDE